MGHLPTAGRLAWDAAHDALGANPIEAVTRGLGDWTLNLLLITLTVTPLRQVTGWAWPGRLRRMFGLFVFFYACLHLASYLWFDQFFDWAEILRDIAKRPFIAFLLLVPLAVTSSNAMVRRLGGKRWQQLHRLAYVASLIAVLHYAWMIKRDLALPMAHGAALLVLLGARAWWLRWSGSNSTPRRSARKLSASPRAEACGTAPALPRRAP